MSHDYAPLPSQDGTELRRRSHVADGVGQGFSLYAVSTAEPALGSSLQSVLRRVLACVRRSGGAAVAALVVTVLLLGAVYFYSLARTSFAADQDDINTGHAIFKDALADECMKSLDVQWQLPVGCDFSGFFVEILTLIEPLTRVFDFRLDIGSCSDSMLKLLQPKERAALIAATAVHAQRSQRQQADVLIQHGDPTAWSSGVMQSLLENKNKAEDGAPARPHLLIGRCMTESSIVPATWLPGLKLMDEVWVPSEFHRRIFTAAGVDASKIAVIGEAIDCDIFDPIAASSDYIPPKTKFKFISSFKWEHRKGWDVLLRAYFNEFTAQESVELELLSYVPSWEKGTSSVQQRVVDAAHAMFPDRSSLPRVTATQVQGLSRLQMRDMLMGADAFVLPTRGEGWGLPVMEAMAMALPVIVTNTSGCSQYLTQDNSFPLTPTPTPDGFSEPHVPQLQALMRKVFDSVNSGDGVAAARGKQARLDIMDRYTPDHVTSEIEKRVQELLKYKPHTGSAQCRAAAEKELLRLRSRQ